MGHKKNKPPPIETSEAAKLTHSPFAGLSGLRGSTPKNLPEDSAGTAPHAAPRGKRRVVLRRETKHRGGKAVIIIGGLDALGFDDAELAELAKECKRALACGGTVDGGEIVLQGDRAADVADLLTSRGFRVAGVTK